MIWKCFNAPFSFNFECEFRVKTSWMCLQYFLDSFLF